MESCDTLAAMKNMTQKNRTPLQPLQSGQVWELEDSNLHIGIIGKTLVHYKHYKANAKRAGISLVGKKVLEKYLAANKAILVQASPPAAFPIRSPA